MGHGRGQVRDGDPGLSHPVREPAGLPEIIRPGDADRRPKLQGREHLPLQGIMGEGKEHAEPIGLAQIERPAQPGLEVG